MTIGWAGWVGIATVAVMLACLVIVIIITIRDVRRDREQVREENCRAALTRHRVQRIHTGADMDTATLMLTHLHQRNYATKRRTTMVYGTCNGCGKSMKGQKAYGVKEALGTMTVCASCKKDIDRQRDKKNPPKNDGWSSY